MKPITESQAADLADNLETLVGNMAAMVELLRSFDDDDRKASTRALCEAIIEDDLLGEEWLSKALSLLRRMLKAYDAGDFEGTDGSTMGAAVAHEALWSAVLDPSLITWTGYGEGLVELGDIDFSEVDAPDMSGVEATFEFEPNGNKVFLTFEDDEWGECVATGRLDNDDERLAALVVAMAVRS